IGVQDCLAALNMTVNPSDDYSLACFLKSPFIEMDEATLYRLCAGRTVSLWHNLLNSPHNDIVQYCKELQQIALTEGIAAFLASLLNKPCPAHSQSGRKGMIQRLGYECDDILNELIAAAQEFERQHINSPLSFI